MQQDPFVIVGGRQSNKGGVIVISDDSGLEPELKKQKR